MKIIEKNSAIATCPFVIFFSTYVGTMFLYVFVSQPLSQRIRLPWLRYPIVAITFSLIFAMSIFEIVSVKRSSCSWLPINVTTRIVFYFAAFLIGIFLIFPIVNFRSDIFFLFRIIGTLCLISVFAYLAGHLRSDSMLAGRKEVTILSLLSRIPFLMLGAVILTLFIIGVMEILSHL